MITIFQVLDDIALLVIDHVPRSERNVFFQYFAKVKEDLVKEALIKHMKGTEELLG